MEAFSRYISLQKQRAWLSRGWAHVRNGTWPARAAWELHRLAEQRRALRWQIRSRRGTTVKVMLQPGVRLRLFTDSELSRLIYVSGFERVERQFVNALLRPGDIFVDVGANIGLFSMIAARLVAPDGRVYAFEPTERTYHRLCGNVALNRAEAIISTHQLALSATAAILELKLAAAGMDAWNSFGEPSVGGACQSSPVEAVAWDDFAQQHGLVGKVALMKIDVEGWESQVLAGGATTLARPDAPTLLIEFTDDAALRAGTTCASLYAQLVGLGYRMFTYNPQRRCLVPDPLRASYPYVNLVAAKVPAAVEARLLAARPQAPGSKCN